MAATNQGDLQVSEAILTWEISSMTKDKPLLQEPHDRIVRRTPVDLHATS